MVAYVLDSSAVLAFLQKEKGAERVKSLLETAREGKAVVYVSEVSLGEVYYILIRSVGQEESKLVLAQVLGLPLVVVSIERRDILAAAEIKAVGGLSFLDCFVIALGKEKKATIITGDREFAPFEKIVNIEWI